MVIRSRFPDVEIPDVSLTHFVLGRAAEFGERPAFLDAALGSAALAGRARVRLPEHCFGLLPKPDELQTGLTRRPARRLSPHAPASLAGPQSTRVSEPQSHHGRTSCD